jgi:malate permease and related proteins
MSLLLRIIEVIVPVFFTVALGYLYARRHKPDMKTFNHIALDVCVPLLTYSALASSSFHLQEHSVLLLGGALTIAGAGLLAWPLARLTGTQPRTLVPVVMFNNCGNMGLPLALLAFGSQNMGPAVALFAISSLMHFSLGARITSAKARTRDLLLSPLMLATMLGFASAYTGLRPPEVVITSMRLLGDASLALMLFTLGTRLTALNWSSAATGVLGAVARPLLGLAVALPLAWALDLQGVARSQLLLFAALPPAVLQFILAERFGQEPEKVAAMVLLGNALALVFVPIALSMGL